MAANLHDPHHITALRSKRLDTAGSVASCGSMPDPSDPYLATHPLSRCSDQPKTQAGAQREVSTLSGGETFQASLSLALGVADAVTALDVLFVDEGFGTLDSEALQLAMDELDRLREGGRTVGLISHVSELRERIRTGIEVQPTDSGSDISVGAVPGV